MRRVLPLVIALAFLPVAAPAQVLEAIEKWADKQIQQAQEEGRREKFRELVHRDPAVRVKALEWFGGNRDAASIDAMGRSLADPDARVREAAAAGLWRSGKDAAAARPQLEAALDDANPNVIAQAAGALQSMGMKEKELVPARKRVLDSTNASLSSRFLAARNLVGEETPLRLLVPMLAYLETNARNDNKELAQKALARLVEATKDRDLIEPLTADLRRAHDAQTIVMKTLGLYNPKPEGWADTLVGLLASPRREVRYEALTQMRSLNQEKDVRVWAPAAASRLRDPESSVRSEALWALGGAGGLAAGEVEKVVAALGDEKEGVRRNAARALGEMGEPTQAVPASAKARVAAAARPALTTAMEKDPDRDVREEAKSALAKIGPGVVAVATAPSTASAGNEAGGLAVLRARNVKFEPAMYFRALGEQDVELVRAFLDAGMSPKDPLFELGPPIRVMLFSPSACNANARPTKAATKETIKLLLERGADVNGADQHGNTALMQAASQGCDRETIRLLVKAGANINATNASKLTPFEMGLWQGHDGLDELIAAGYRLPREKVKGYQEGYKDRPAALAMIRKAAVK
jgi:HEAT repeat protein